MERRTPLERLVCEVARESKLHTTVALVRRTESIESFFQMKNESTESTKDAGGGF